MEEVTCAHLELQHIVICEQHHSSCATPGRLLLLLLDMHGALQDAVVCHKVFVATS
jgi:hypothetical protein